jgi:hypothetical protein
MQFQRENAPPHSTKKSPITGIKNHKNKLSMITIIVNSITLKVFDNGVIQYCCFVVLNPLFSILK